MKIMQSTHERYAEDLIAQTGAVITRKSDGRVRYGKMQHETREYDWAYYNNRDNKECFAAWLTCTIAPDSFDQYLVTGFIAEKDDVLEAITARARQLRR